MSFVQGGFTHGGAGFTKELIRRAMAGGWSFVEGTDNRPSEWASAAVVQTDTLPVSVSVAGLPVNAWIDLPVCFIGTLGLSVRANFGGSSAILGTDYMIDRLLGRFQILPGGVFDSPSTPGVGRTGYSLTLDPGYQLLSGWAVFSSTGVSGQESHLFGVQFDRREEGTPANPGKTGARLSLFSTWTNGSTNYGAEVITTRNMKADDVLCFLAPTLEGQFQASVNLDRIIAHGITDCQACWCFVGGLARFRPVIEQGKTLCMMGSTSAKSDDARGPVGQTNEAGTQGQNMGAAWLYDLARFSDATNPVMLNANRWSKEAGNPANGYTPSRVPLNSPPLGTMPNLYFEVHEVIPGRFPSVINSVSNVLYGLAEGLMAVLVYGPRHNLELTWDGRIFRLWKVGSRSDRFVAVEKV